MIDNLWRASREWEGEIAFIVAGGPSAATQNMQLLRDRKVIAINCSAIDTEKHPALVPWAEFLVFADSRFYHHYKQKVIAFKGRVISASQTVRGEPKVFRMHRKSTPGLSADTAMLTVKMTTLTAAINLAVHLGSRAIVLLGADGRKSPEGKSHHHADHPWRQLNGCWDKQKADLKPIAADLSKLGIPCINASPGSAWADIWPLMELPEAIKKLEIKEDTIADQHVAVLSATATDSAATAPA